MTAFTWFYDVDYSESQDEILKECAKLKYPLIVKPATLGSSVGINFAKDEEELKNAIEEAISYDKKILVEHAVENLSEVKFIGVDVDKFGSLAGRYGVRAVPTLVLIKNGAVVDIKTGLMQKESLVAFAKKAL